MKPVYILVGLLAIIAIGLLGKFIREYWLQIKGLTFRDRAEDRSFESEFDDKSILPSIKKHLGNHNNIAVSYILDISDPASRISYKQCMSNLHYFLQFGFVSAEEVTYNFIILGDKTPQNIKNLKYLHRNVHIIEAVRHNRSDLDLHTKMLQPLSNSTDLFLLLNCAALGPFYPIPASNVGERSKFNSFLWLQPFISVLSKSVKLVGPTIRCVASPFVQGYAMLFDNVGIEILSALQHRVDSISDIMFSHQLLSQGYNIASLDARHHQKDFRQQQVCDQEFHHLETSRYQDPTACYDRGKSYMIDSPGCRGVEPCLVTFVKTGSNIAQQQLIAPYTLKRIKQEADALFRARLPSMCTTAVAPARPYWNIPELYQKASDARPHSLSMNHTSPSLAIIIRAHAAYTTQLLSFLWMLESANLANHMNIIAVIVPTEADSMSIISKALSQSFLPFSKNLTVVPLHIPTSIFNQYSPYLGTLCTEKWKQEMISTKQHSAKDVSRHCDVNSPLHYLLVDIAMYYLKASCKNCRRLIVTNADNSYSPKFFDAILSPTRAQDDVVMTHMITRGTKFPVKAEVGKIDLGAYAVSFEFLRRTGVSFLSSIPSHPQANDYHNADGHFLVQLLRHRARTSLIDEYLFYHN